jgi:hypothetical protein
LAPNPYISTLSAGHSQRRNGAQHDSPLHPPDVPVVRPAVWQPSTNPKSQIQNPKSKVPPPSCSCHQSSCLFPWRPASSLKFSPPCPPPGSSCNLAFLAIARHTGDQEFREQRSITVHGPLSTRGQIQIQNHLPLPLKNFPTLESCTLARFLAKNPRPIVPQGFRRNTCPPHQTFKRRLRRTGIATPPPPR